MKTFIFSIFLITVIECYDFFYKKVDDDVDETFPYSDRAVCQIKQIDDHFYVSIFDVYLGVKSCPQKIVSSTGRRLLSCYHRNRSTRIVFRNGTDFIGVSNANTNQQWMIRDNPTAIVFDAFRSKLYGLYSNRFLYELDRDRPWHKILPPTDLRDEPGEIMDIAIFNNVIYLIVKQQQQQTGNRWFLVTRSGEVRRQESTNFERISFILTSNGSDGGCYQQQEQRIKKNVGVPVFLPSLEGFGVADKPEFKNGNIWLFLLYVIDLLFLAGIVYLLLLLKKQQIEKQRKQLTKWAELKPIITKGRGQTESI